MISREAHASIGLLAACYKSILTSGWSTGAYRSQEKAFQVALCVTNQHWNGTSVSNPTHFSTLPSTTQCQTSRAQPRSSIDALTSSRVDLCTRQPLLATIKLSQIPNQTVAATWWLQHQQQRSMAGLGAAWKRRVLKQRSQMLEQTLTQHHSDEDDSSEHDSSARKEHAALQRSRAEDQHWGNSGSDQVDVKETHEKRSRQQAGIKADTEIHVDAWEHDMQQARKQRLEDYYQDSSWKNRDRKVVNKLQPRRSIRSSDDSDDEMQTRLGSQEEVGPGSRYGNRSDKGSRREKQRGHFQESRSGNQGYVDMESDIYRDVSRHGSRERAGQQPNIDRRPAARLFIDRESSRGTPHDRQTAFRVIDDDIGSQAQQANPRDDRTASQDRHTRRHRDGMSRSASVEIEGEQGTDMERGGRQQSAESRWHQLLVPSRHIKNPAELLAQLEALALEAAAATNFRMAMNGINRAGQLLGKLKSECSDPASISTHANQARTIISQLVPKLKGKDLKGFEISQLILSCASSGYNMDQDMLAEVLEAVTKDNCSLLLNSPEKAMVQLMHGLATLLGYKSGRPAGEQETAMSVAAAQPGREISDRVTALRSILMKDVGQLISKHADAISANALAPLLASFSRLGCTDVDMYEAAAKSITSRHNELTTASVSSLGITNRNLLNHDCKVPGLLNLVGDKIADKPLELLPTAWPDLLLPFAAFKHAHPQAVAALFEHLPMKLKDMHPLRAALVVQSAVSLEPQLVAQQQDILRSVTQHTATSPTDSKTIAACAIIMIAWGKLGLLDSHLFTELCAAASRSMANEASAAQDAASNHTQGSSWVNQPLLPVLLAESARAGILHPQFQQQALFALSRALPGLPAEASALVAQAAADIYAMTAHDSSADTSHGFKPIIKSTYSDLDTDSVKQLGAESSNALAIAMQQLIQLTPEQLTQWASQQHHKQFTVDQIKELQPAALLLHKVKQKGSASTVSYNVSSFVGLTNATDKDAFIDFQRSQHILHDTVINGISSAGQLMATVFAQPQQEVQHTVHRAGIVEKNSTLGNSSQGDNLDAAPVDISGNAQEDQEARPHLRTASLAAAVGRLYQGKAIKQGLKQDCMRNRDGMELLVVVDKAVLADCPIQIHGREYKGIVAMFLRQQANAAEDDHQHQDSNTPAANTFQPGLDSLRAYLLQSAGYMLLPLHPGEWDRLNGLHAAQEALLASKSGVL